MDTQGVDEDDDVESDDWSPVVRGKGGKTNFRQSLDASASASQNNKRSLEGNSSEEDNRMVRRKVERQEFKIIIKFRKTSSPKALTKELKKKLGAVEMSSEILQDGNVLVKCRNEEKRNKALKLFAKRF